MDPAFQERRRHQAREELKAALRMSCREADIPMTSVGYRAVVDVSDDEEDAYLDIVVDQLEEEVEAECCTPSDESPLPDELSLPDDWEDEEQAEEEDGEEAWAPEPQKKRKKRSGRRPDDDHEGQEEEAAQTPTPQKRKRRGRQAPEPDSDNDPDPPQRDDVASAPDQLGWTRSLLKVKMEQFVGPKPKGPSFRKHRSPVSYLFQFFSIAMFIQISQWTNTNLMNAGVHVLTTTKEIKAWFGIHLVMGLVKISYYQDYWSSDPGYYNRLIATTMTRNRFDTLTKHLACADPKKDPEKYLQYDPTRFNDRAHQYLSMRNKPLYPLQPLWASVVARCHSGFNVGRQLAIDEAMVQYSGFKAKVRKFFMPLKPIRAGFKIYAIADSATGYISNFIVHPYKGGKPAKMTDIAMEVVEPHLGKYHHIFTDKLYTSVELARRLLSKKTYLTGAVKSTTKGLPTDFSSSQQKNPHHHQKMKRLNKMARGTFYSRQNGQITCVLWKDSRVMPLLSTFHQGYRDRIQDTLSRKVQDSMGRRKATIIPAPRQAVDYTKHMGGVDRGDQLRSYYTCSRKSQYWWRKLMYFLVRHLQS